MNDETCLKRDLLKELIHQKKHLLLGRLASLESETESECNNSESGSIITNPAFHRTRGIFSSIRSAVSDTDVESNYLSSRGGSSNLWNCKSSLTSGYRYHGGDMVSTMQLPPPDLIRTYIFQGIINKYAFIFGVHYIFFN
ncbi:uncharacterized protein LOC111711991 [Eurytemora carolleeae]|uniref:uncharacterized protein LOC111711991 n=1 Tax=Eurytemora carolleeae TaxID=1294199 RepID=UPI000C78170E|nr:uncharacterized protein LOC111711991 [Eurytemora carolleeae]|eukprot:XP_023342261.1 uncharacterized protein LOC111711991 [Eurytemora affinis]